MYQKWPSKPSILSRVSPGHLYYLFLDTSPTYVSKIFPRTKQISRIDNLKIWKSKNPGSLTGAQLNTQHQTITRRRHIKYYTKLSPLMNSFELMLQFDFRVVVPTELKTGGWE